MTGFVNLSPAETSFVESAIADFKGSFHWSPSWASLSPGRVNVIGEHVDYNGGWVLPAAIERHTVIVAHPRTDRKIRLQSTAYNEQAAFSLDALEGGRDWTSYIRGVLAGLQQQGCPLTGFDAFIDTTIPVGGGLSSSAALEAATALLGLKLAGTDMDRMALARLCQKAEHDFAGVPCGIMDQTAVLNCAKGHLLLLDCKYESFQQAPFTSDDWQLMIINSNVAHELASGEYAKRRAACHDAASCLNVETLRDVALETLPQALANPGLTEEMRRCVRHVVTENDRVQKTVKALAQHDFSLAGSLLKASHESLRDDYRVSCRELDFIVSHLSGQPGVAGCRMTGGGFGGSCIALVQKEAAADLQQSIQAAYSAACSRQADCFTTRPTGSATAFRLPE